MKCRSFDAIEEMLARAAKHSRVRQAISQYLWWWRTYDDPVGAVDFAGDFLETPAEFDEFVGLLAMLA